MAELQYPGKSDVWKQNEKVTSCYSGEENFTCFACFEFGKSSAQSKFKKNKDFCGYLEIRSWSCCRLITCLQIMSRALLCPIECIYWFV